MLYLFCSLEEKKRLNNAGLTPCSCGCGINYDDEEEQQLWIECDKCKEWWRALCVPLTKKGAGSVPNKQEKKVPL